MFLPKGHCRSPLVPCRAPNGVASPWRIRNSFDLETVMISNKARQLAIQVTAFNCLCAAVVYANTEHASNA